MDKNGTIEDLCDFILDNWSESTNLGGGWQPPTFPNFDLYARDYIFFAESELEQYLIHQRPAQLINCVSHLKRAAECQIDTFLHVVSLDKLFTKKNLGFDRKLDFLNATSIFTSRTLKRFNTLRNRMEHTYELPVVQDIEAYFDVVTAFVAVLESAIPVHSSLEYGIREIEECIRYKENLFIEYVFDGPAVQAKWGPLSATKSFYQDTSDIHSFSRAFRLFRLLVMEDAHASDKWVRARVEEVKANQRQEPIR